MANLYHINDYKCRLNDIYVPASLQPVPPHLAYNQYLLTSFVLKGMLWHLDIAHIDLALPGACLPNRHITPPPDVDAGFAPCFWERPDPTKGTH